MRLPLFRPAVWPALLLALLCTASWAQTNGNAAPSSASETGGTVTGVGVNSAAGASAAAAGTVTASDKVFMAKAAANGLYEVQASQLAAARATESGIRDYAQMLVQHHTEANAELTQIALHRGVALPDAPAADKKAVLERLSKLSGPAFGREYMRQVGIDDHKADIKLFEAASRSATNPDLKSWIDKVLPVLRGHLSEAQKTPQPVAGNAAKPDLPANTLRHHVSNPQAQTRGLP